MSQEKDLNVLRTQREGVQIADLKDLLSRKEEDLNKTRATLDGIREERDQLRRKVHNLTVELNKTKGLKGSSNKLYSPETSSDTLRIAKKAERVKIKKTQFNSPKSKESHAKPIHGRDLDPDVLSSGTTEQLLQDVITTSKAEEIFSRTNKVSSVGKDDFVSNLRESLQLEIEKINCRLEKLKTENGLLRLTLQESKSRTEQLQMLLSKFESNDTAHGLTLFYSEVITEAYDAVMHAIEKDILRQDFLKGVLVHLKRSHHVRIQRVLSGLCALMSNDSPPNNLHSSEEFLNQCFENSDNPDARLSPSKFASVIGLCRELGERKNAVKRSIVNLESFSVEALQSPVKPERSVSEFDLENAVLLHELASVKEELVNLKCEYSKTQQDNVPLLSDDNPTADDEKSSSTSLGFAFNGSVQSSHEKDSDVGLNKKPAFLSLADLRIGTMTESELGIELSEAIKREERLKKENDRVSFMLQQVQQNGEKRHMKSLEMVKTLKNSYSTLLENSKKDKLKHITRVRELEEILCLSEEQHVKQINDLRRKILEYERERENLNLPDNETAL